METEKDPRDTDNKRAYRSPQLTQFGSVANITRVNKPGDEFDNVLGSVMGPMVPPGLS
jgi:hypothetical protein